MGNQQVFIIKLYTGPSKDKMFLLSAMTTILGWVNASVGLVGGGGGFYTLHLPDTQQLLLHVLL